VDLIKYLLSVKDDIPPEDLKRLRQTPICLAETHSNDAASKGKLYCIPELYEPEDAIKRLGLPVLQWPGQYRASTPEGRFLRFLGLQPHPSVPDLVDILSKAPAGSELQTRTINYWVMNAFHNGYAKFPVADIDKAFLPVLPFAGEGKNLIAKPSQCYANPKAAVLRFRTLREDLQPHHALFGVALEPPIVACADKLIKSPPADRSSAQLLFGYLAGRLGEIGPNGNLAERLGNAPIVPVADRTHASRTKFISPRACFLGNGDVYGDIFDFVDFGHEANSFLQRVGCKYEPSAVEIAEMVVRQPTRLLSTLGSEKYLMILRKIAESAAVIKKDKLLWQRLKTSPCLLAEKQVRVGGASHSDEKDEYDDDVTVKEHSLVKANDMVLVDDFASYGLFDDVLLAAPQEEVLEGLYAALETPLLSKLIEDDQRKGALLHDQSSGAKLQKLLAERCRLFLHDQAPDAIRHDAKWLEQSLSVQVTEFLQVTRKLRGYKVQHVEKRTAALHRETKRDAILFITPRYDLYEVSRAIAALLLKRPRQQDVLAFETIMESDLRRLKTKGYNVDRILRAKAAESRIAESELRKRAEEQQRLIEAESATRPTQAPAAKSNVMSHSQQQQPQVGERPATPDKQLSMPGSFSDSPETAKSSELTDRGKKPTSLFNSISKHLGFNSNNQASEQMQNMLSGGQSGRQADLPPPYEPGVANGSANGPVGGKDRVTSPRDVQSNLQSAIKASREYGGSALSSQQQSKEIKETPTYCDHKPAQDIQLIAELDSGFKLYLSRDNPDPNAFLQTQRDAIVKFVIVLTAVAQIFDLPPKTINIYHDEKGAAIAFNSNGSLFCNLRYFMQLHVAHMASPEGKVDAVAYWWITLCHGTIYSPLFPIIDAFHTDLLSQNWPTTWSVTTVRTIPTTRRVLRRIISGVWSGWPAALPMGNDRPLF
jgi:hypothetical protein